MRCRGDHGGSAAALWYRVELGFTVYGLRFTVYGLRFTVYGLRFTV